MNVLCEGCGATASGTAEELFDLGWDCPPQFTQHTTCPNCPITSTAWWLLMQSKMFEQKEN